MSMTSNKSWGVEPTTKDDLCYVVLYVSRTKDNKTVGGFKERRKSFICTKEKLEYYYDKQFDLFVDEGVYWEMSRMYVSVNPRSMDKIRKQLIHFMIDNPDFNLCSIQSKIAGIAATKECAADKQWLVDFDSSDFNLVEEFCKDIRIIDPTVEKTIQETPNGYGIILSHGFDSRKLMEHWSYVATIKKDDLKCVTWKRKC